MKFKNKTFLYAIVRKDINKGQDVICAFTRTLDGAENLCEEYSQQYLDVGGDPEEAYFYVVSQLFYDK